MKNKYIVPSLKIWACVADSHLLEGSPDPTKKPESIVGGDPASSVPKESEDVDMGAKRFNAWDTWD